MALPGSLHNNFQQTENFPLDFDYSTGEYDGYISEDTEMWMELIQYTTDNIPRAEADPYSERYTQYEADQQNVHEYSFQDYLQPTFVDDQHSPQAHHSTFPQHNETAYGFQPRSHASDADAHQYIADTLQDDEPWSTEKKHDGHSDGLKLHVDHLVEVVGTSEASRTSGLGESASDSFSTRPSTASSTEEGDTQEWGQTSVLTLRPGNHLSADQTSQSSWPQHSFEHTGQGQMPGEASANGYRMDVRESTLDQTATMQTGPERNDLLRSSHNSFLSVDSLQTPGAEPPSSASSTTSDVLYCPLCPAKFQGAYRRGNWGRHNRDKHKGEVRTYPCEDDNCNKVFLRPDARLKHYRKKHLHLASGPAVASTYSTNRHEANTGLGGHFGASSQRDLDLRDIWTGQ